MSHRVITVVERAARLAGNVAPIHRNKPFTTRPMAQFRKKGCKTCQPIPAPTRLANNDTI